MPRVIAIRVQDLPALKGEIEDIFGAEYLAKSEELRTPGLRRIEADRRQAKADPLLTWWNSFSTDVENSIASGRVTLSANSLYLLDFLFAYRGMCDLEHSSRIKHDLLHRNQFHSSVFETRVVSAYRNLGHAISIQPEGKNRRCDFIVHTSSGPIGIDAKNLDDITSEEQVHWHTVMRRVAAVIAKRQISYHLMIRSHKAISGSDAEEIIRQIDIDALRYLIGEQTVCGGSVSISYRWFGPWERTYAYSGPFTIHTAADYTEHGMEAVYHGDGTLTYSKRYLIEIFTYFEEDISRRIIKQIDKAAGQFLPGVPAIVHVALPYKKGEELLRVVDRCYDRVFNQLNFSRTSINAVVVSAVLPKANVPWGEHPLRYDTYVIPNMRSKVPLPEDFRILGTNDLGLGKIGPEGTAVRDFLPFRPLREQLGRTILWHSTGDGQSQIRVWQDYRNETRIELVAPELGRKILTVGGVEVKLNTWNRIAVRWWQAGMDVLLDGHKIGELNFAH